MISSKLNDDDEKLHYLVQYTSGKPRDLIETRLHMETNKEYEEARLLLERRYGNSAVIATAYVNKILNWEIVKKDDIKGLDEFAIILESCRNTVFTPYGVVELHNPKTIRAILRKLPYYIQDGWRRKINDLKEKKGKDADFNDLVRYIESEAKIVTNTLFGKT